MRVSDVIALCRDLGFMCRYDCRTGEFRLALPLNSYPGTHREQTERQEAQAYYDTEGQAICAQARHWQLTLRTQEVTTIRYVAA
jgi:hypothetical protein